MYAWIKQGIVKVLDYMFWPLAHEQQIDDKREDPLLAIMFSLEGNINHSDVVVFLKMWSEGDWQALQDQFPEWVNWMGARGIDVYYEPRLQ